MRVWLPYKPEQFDGLPDGIDVDVYDGAGDPPASISEVEFYVPPYLGGKHTLELIPSMPKLRVVQTLTAGVDDVRPFLNESVVLCNARGVHDASTAELALTLTLASLRGIPDFVLAQQEGRWIQGYRESLADKTVLIVGYGSVGKAIEARLIPFECDVLRVARSARDGVADLSALPDLLPRADIVILIVPLTDETRGMVDPEFLSRMRDGALLVNVARGPVVDTDALRAELSSGRIRAALDVTDPEPLPPDHPLWRTPGVLISPHVGGFTSAFLSRALRLVRDQLRRYVTGEPLANVMSAAY